MQFESPYTPLMRRRIGPARAPLVAIGFLALVALVAVIAIPALAASPPTPPSGGDGGPVSKTSKQPEIEVTLRGVVGTATDADGSVAYTLTVDGKVVRLDAGPSWFFGAKHPLGPFVGKTVTITGGQSGDEVDVETVDGTRLRAPGKPPWAGGWKAVGSAHPGWTQEKQDRWQAKHGDKASKTRDHTPDASDGPTGD